MASSSPQESSTNDNLKQEEQKQSNNEINLIKDSNSSSSNIICEYPEINYEVSDKGEVQAFIFLVISALHHLYYENETDRIFMKHFFKNFADNKKIQTDEQKILEDMMLDGGFEKDSIQMNVSTLKMTSIYQKYGPKIFIMNLILICIKEGVYDSRAKTLIKFLAYQLILEQDEKKSKKSLTTEKNGEAPAENGNDESDIDDGDSGCHDTDALSNVCQTLEELKVKSETVGDDKNNFDEQKNFYFGSHKNNGDNDIDEEKFENTDKIEKQEEKNDEKPDKSNENKDFNETEAENEDNNIEVNIEPKEEVVQDVNFLRSIQMIREIEDRLQIGFLNKAYEQSEKEKEEQMKRESRRKIKKYAMIGLVSVGGGVLIGVTAGLAAPLVAGGLGLTAGAVGSVLFATKAGLAVVGSLFGLAGAGLTGHKMNKRVGDLEEFEFEELSEGRSLTVTLAITGWLSEKYTGFRKVWLGLDNSTEQYVLVYESKHMRQLGDSLKRFTDLGISMAMTHTLGYTALSGLMQAMMWPMALLNMAEVIDNPWSVCTKRSFLAGEHLADVLLAREQGNRPVCLVGFGMGARVIFSCLQEMAKRKNSEGIIEEVILLGAPVTADVEQWKKLKKVVSGRIVNGYSRSDWLLRFIFRTASAQLTVAGLQPIEWEDRIMHNVNLKDVVSNHFDYIERIDEILALAYVKCKKRVPLKEMSSLAQWTSLKSQQSPKKNTDVKDSLKPAIA